MLPDRCPSDPDPTLWVSYPMINWSIDYTELPASIFGLTMTSQFCGHFCPLHFPTRLKFQDGKDIISKMLISSSLGAARTSSDILCSKVSKFPIPKYTGHNFGTRLLWHTSYIPHHTTSTIPPTWSRSKEASVACITPFEVQETIISFHLRIKL